jgi:hypothetical protein
MNKNNNERRMKKVIFNFLSVVVFFLGMHSMVYGQIDQRVHLQTGSVKSTPISVIDSIRFGSGGASMEIIKTSGGSETHQLNAIQKVDFQGAPVGSISTLDCVSSTNTGTLTSGTAASGVSASVPYTGGNGGTHNGQTVSSTGVSGLTATLVAGSFANGAGSLTYAITGTPSSSGTASFALNIGGQTCTITFPVNAPVGLISTLDCVSSTNTGTLTSGKAASGVSASVPYTGGNGGTHNGQTVSSTGVSGLTATLVAGSFANGSGSLTYAITGTPSSSGTASFALNIGGQTCTISIAVVAGTSFICGKSTVTFNYNAQTVTYGTVVGANNSCWFDRNLGAAQVATSSIDENAFGDLFQWGRYADGHQIRNSAITSIKSSIDNPYPNGNGLFITTSTESESLDWRSPENTNLWQGVSGINNPCPTGWRLPNDSELISEIDQWGSLNGVYEAINSPLKLPKAGMRLFEDGQIDDQYGFYWSSTREGMYASYLKFDQNSILLNGGAAANGGSVRCIKD